MARKVDIPKFRHEVESILKANNAQFSYDSKRKIHPDIVFKSKNYECKVELNDRWIGYSLKISAPKGSMVPQRSNDTDIYPIYGGKFEVVALEIYDDLIDTVSAIFEGRIYYKSTPEFSYIAQSSQNGTYSVDYLKKKKFLFFRYASGRKNNELQIAEFRGLNLRTLS